MSSPSEAAARSDRTEGDVEAFWNAHPCGTNLVDDHDGAYEDFFQRYDAHRALLEPHISRCMDELDLAGRDVLEVGLGQGADSEQLIRRGARWTGIDLTAESVGRVRVRMQVRALPYRAIVHGTVLDLPFPDESFDLVYSHGVLHHVPDIVRAQAELARVLRPGGQLVAMVYAKRSLNYFSIAVIRRLGLAAMLAFGLEGRGIVREHVDRARAVGWRRYLAMDHFVHANTDGPDNPYSKVYRRRDLVADFPAFRLERAHREFMHAPPLPVHGLPGASVLGWHLWAHLRKR